jgi:hypothetical protein
MKCKQFVVEGLREVGRQLFGYRTKRRSVYKYILTLSVPVPENRISQELRKTALSDSFIRIETLAHSRYGYNWKK